MHQLELIGTAAGPDGTERLAQTAAEGIAQGSMAGPQFTLDPRGPEDPQFSNRVVVVIGGGDGATLCAAPPPLRAASSASPGPLTVAAAACHRRVAAFLRPPARSATQAVRTTRRSLGCSGRSAPNSSRCGNPNQDHNDHNSSDWFFSEAYSISSRFLCRTKANRPAHRPDSAVGAPVRHPVERQIGSLSIAAGAATRRFGLAAGAGLHSRGSE